MRAGGAFCVIWTCYLGRPGESQDPYRAILLWHWVVDDHRKNCGLGLLVLAFARTTGDILHVFAARFARAVPVISPSSKARGRREGWVAAAPGAPAQKEFARARKSQVQAVTTGLPAQWFTAYRRSPSVNQCSFATVACAFGARLRLGASVGAPGLRNFAVRKARRSSHGIFASTAFRPTFVTTRTPLSSARNGSNMRRIQNSENKKIFTEVA